MNDLSGRVAALTPEQRAQLGARLGIAQQRPELSPIAVIGVGCRFPGADSPEEFWRRLCEGFDAIRTAPADRWEADKYFSTDKGAPGKSNSRWGGFLDRVDQFDREFFGLSPREAAHMDPQQRLLLETAWEALEDAGQMTDRLPGCAAGVFVGAQSHSSDYYMMQARDRERLDTYTATGTAHSILANRLSFLLDLRGPSLAVDTACSSSLVAVHLACQSLRLAESDLAIAGGVNLILTPDFHICLGKMEMMAPDGRCKTFDHRADGFVRGEGCGVVILKRLPDALRDRDPVLAVILGSAVGQDGASNGLTAPSGVAQQAVVRRALEAAQVAPEKIGYVETHGAGTALGDPVEVEALTAVLGATGQSCVLGALKTNVGHLEAASGIAGFIKAVLCLKHGSIPPNLHFERLNPHLSLAGARFVLPTELRPWPRAAEPRFAGVSSFGFGGTNAHVVLSEAPENAASPARDNRELLLPISARSAPALRALAASYVEFLTTGDGAKLPPADIAYTASSRRLQHDYSWCVAGASPADWAAALGELLEKGISPIPSARGSQGLFPGGRCVRLPRYPWQRQRYWLEEPGEGPPADWFYELDWQPHGSPASRVSALESVDLASAPASLEFDTGGFAGLREALDELSAGYIWAALAPASGDRLPTKAQCIPRYERLAARLHAILQAAGVLRDDGAVLRRPAPARSDALLERFPAAREVLELHARCGARLGDVLRGQCDPLELLFAGGEKSLAEAVYRDAAPSRLGNRLAGEAVREWVARLPKNRTLRVLEIGAGTGGTTAALLPLLPADRCEYVFTDISPLFLKRASENFARYPFVRYELFDLEKPPVEQGFGRFDLVIAANVVHATSDLAVSLGHAKSLLAPGGILLLIECTEPRPWMEITFGLTEGWWRFTDREAHPLLNEAAWIKSLGERGFADATALPLRGPAAALFDQALLFARNPRESQSAKYLLFADPQGLGDRLRQRLEARGDVCCTARPGDDPRKFSACKAAIYVADSDCDDLEAACQRPLRAVQALLEAGLSFPDGLWLVTRGGQPVATGEAPSPPQALLWGLGRGVTLEAPGLGIRLLDLDPAEGLDESASALLAEIDDPGPEDQIARRRERRYAVRLKRAPELGRPRSPLRFTGTHLITGGLGGVGAQLALRLAAGGAGHLLLLVKNPVEGARAEIVRKIKAAGARVTVAAIDLADESALEKWFAAADPGPLRGVWHAAMSFSSAPAGALKPEAVSAMIKVKSAAAWRLHVLSRAHPLDHFVLFSSTTALWGAAGLAHYAAANAFLDALAHFRRAKGLRATVVNWGAWEEMRALPAAERERAARAGLRPMPPAAALEALECVLGAGVCQAVVADVDWSVFKPAYESQRPRPLLECAASKPAKSAEQSPVDRLRQAPADERREMLARHVEHLLTAVLGMGTDGFIERDKGFFEMGMDSLTSVQLRARLERDLGRTLPGTLTFKYPTVDSLADYLLGELFPNAAAKPGADATEDELFSQLEARLARPK